MIHKSTHTYTLMHKHRHKQTHTDIHPLTKGQEYLLRRQIKCEEQRFALLKRELCHGVKFENALIYGAL